MPIIPPHYFNDLWQWLDANADELARMAGVSQQQGIKAALREIAKATGSDWNIMGQILATISGNKLLPLFTRNPTCFSEIAKIALRHTNSAFQALNASALSELMRKNPEGLKKLVTDVIASASKMSLPAAVDSALLSLSNDNVAAISIKNPVLLIKTFSQITEVSREFSPYIFSAIADENISELFAEDPEIILSAYSEVAESSNREAAAIFISELRRQRLFELFKREPKTLVKSLTESAKACDPNSAAIFYLLRRQRIAYLLEMNPESLFSSINGFVKAAGKGAGAAVPLIFDERVEERFVNDAVALGKSFNSLIEAAGDGVSRAISLVTVGGMLNMFLKDPGRVISLFSSIAKASGNYADAAFGFLANPRMAALLDKDPDAMMQTLGAISASSGDSAPIVFAFLGKEGVAARFEQDPDKMADFFSMIGETTAGGKKDAFAMFANPKFIQGFESWPEQAMENLKRIADSARPYAGDVFTLLSKDRFAQAITELVSGEHLATCLVNLVNNSGKDTSMVMQLFKNDGFAKCFINDPYREVQIVEHLRSFAGRDFAYGLEVLNDPEIAPVFAEDPSALVTTRFRYYVEGATAMPDTSALDALDAIMEDKKVKELFIEYVRQEFHGGGKPGMLENELLPAFTAYMEKNKKNG